MIHVKKDNMRHQRLTTVIIRQETEQVDSSNQESPMQQNAYEESADDSSLLHHTTPQNPYGPWMLVKRPPRKRLSGNQDKDREKGAKATGSRFNILKTTDEPTETVEAEITAPVQIPEQKMTRIRDPTAGKNRQQHKKELHRKQPTPGKTVKLSENHPQPKTIVTVPKEKGKEPQLPTLPNKLSERKDRIIPAKSQDQKLKEHDYVMQLIKKMGSEQEMQNYHNSWKVDQSNSQMPKGAMQIPINPKPPDPE
ncbi:hypothetical protein SESBI_17185 [Sesbania bispinosa]|nr:hypothetical protein SESBI_17185 [Sesbania bispinosa]